MLNASSWLMQTPIAHRGLWSSDIPENSIPAYENAIAHGFAIEIDVYSSADGQLFCFHDATLMRVTGKKGFIYEKTAKELKRLKLFSTEYSIPTFEETLAVCENRAPLLIEIKNQPDKKVVDKVVERLKSYAGEFAIQSFNPFFIKRVKKLAPEFVRGILGTNEKIKENFFTRWALKRLPFNNFIKPHFISYYKEGLPVKNKRNLPVLAWTIISDEEKDNALKFANNIIFENFVP